MTGIIIVICCTLAGFAIGKYFQNRITDKGNFYRDLSSYVAILKDNVCGRQLEMSAFNAQFAQNCGKHFGEYLLNGKLNVRLSKLQKGNLIAFFGNLDCVSSQALMEQLDYHGKIIVDDAQAVLKNETAKAQIYSKIGMLLGAMLGILLA